MGTLTPKVFYKHTTILNDNSSVVNKMEALLTDDTRDVIYDRHMFIIQATGFSRYIDAQSVL